MRNWKTKTQFDASQKNTISADDSFAKNEAEVAELIDLETQEKRKIVVDEKLLGELQPESKWLHLFYRYLRQFLSCKNTSEFCVFILAK